MTKSLLINSLVNFSNNSNNIWWKKIHLRVYMLMKLILLETKKHNLQNVYKLQNYLINSIEAKIFLLSVTIPRIYYIHYNNTKSKLNRTNKNKESVVNDLHKIIAYYANKDLTCKTINKYIKQNLVYICIQPVWKAKLVKNLNNYSYIRNIYNKYYQNSFFLVNKYFKKKLMSYIYKTKPINQCLDDIVCLSNKIRNHIFYNKHFNSFSKKSSRKNQFCSNFLIKIIYNILINDLNWYLFSVIKSETIHKKIFINKSFIPNQKKEDFVDQRLTTFSYFKLIKKDKKKLVDYIFKYCRKFYYKIKHFINIKESNKINFHVSTILNMLIRQQKKYGLKRENIFYKSRTINFTLNKIIYINNLNNKYII